ncbi:mediator complex subunit MED7 [Sporobolomyces salmoneus]|uniref:mediator complex subunit MED7 n=1 Tax=Sporobolomyces salmoneus TaxID=183962 RepID=UPI00316BAC3A
MEAEYAHQQQDQEQLAAPEFDTSFFPAPSPYFHRYSSHNLSLPPDSVISDVPGEPRPFLAKELEPPNVDWIVEEGSYSVFGETWPIEEHLPTLEEMGLKEMFDKSRDRKQSLQTLLRALLLSYTQLLNSLLTPPPSLLHPPPAPPSEPSNHENGAQPPSQPPSDPERLTEHIRLITINMHHLVNELRPVQARETLKLMMRYQIDRRKEKTLAIKQRCQEIRSTLADLQTKVQTTSNSTALNADGRNDTATRSDTTPTASSADPESIRQHLAKLIEDL